MTTPHTHNLSSWYFWTSKTNPQRGFTFLLTNERSAEVCSCVTTLSWSNTVLRTNEESHHCAPTGVGCVAGGQQQDLQISKRFSECLLFPVWNKSGLLKIELSLCKTPLVCLLWDVLQINLGTDCYSIVLFFLVSCWTRQTHRIQHFTVFPFHWE